MELCLKSGGFGDTLEKGFVEPKKEENFKSLKFRAILEQYNRSLVLVL